MMGLESIPTLKNLSRAYQKLQSAPQKVLSKEWVLWSQWARFDARLAEQLVLGMFNHWKKISAIELNARLRESPWPAAFGVILDHAILGFAKGDSNQKIFKAWAALVMSGIVKANFEQFFIGTTGFGSLGMRQRSSSPTKPYLVWGYLGNDFLWNKQKPTKTITSKWARLNMLNELTKKQKRISVQDYRNMLGGTIGLRQAERDLAKYPRLKAVGNTRGRYYVLC